MAIKHTLLLSLKNCAGNTSLYMHHNGQKLLVGENLFRVLVLAVKNDIDVSTQNMIITFFFENNAHNTHNTVTVNTGACFVLKYFQEMGKHSGTLVSHLL